MAQDQWHSWYAGWGWFLWFAMIFLVFSSFGNWGYTYRAHRLYRDVVGSKTARDLVNERYARGEIGRDEFQRIKKDIEEGSNISARGASGTSEPLLGSNRPRTV